jgi:hypothetical protein
VAGAIGCTVVAFRACADLASTLGQGYISVDIGAGLDLVLVGSLVMTGSIVVNVARSIIRTGSIGAPVAPGGPAK